MSQFNNNLTNISSSEVIYFDKIMENINVSVCEEEQDEREILEQLMEEIIEEIEEDAEYEYFEENLYQDMEEEERLNRYYDPASYYCGRGRY